MPQAYPSQHQASSYAPSFQQVIYGNNTIFLLHFICIGGGEGFFLLTRDQCLSQAQSLVPQHQTLAQAAAASSAQRPTLSSQGAALPIPSRILVPLPDLPELTVSLVGREIDVESNMEWVKVGLFSSSRSL